MRKNIQLILLITVTVIQSSYTQHKKGNVLMMNNYRTEIVEKITLSEDDYYSFTEDVEKKIEDFLDKNSKICGIGFKIVPVLDLKKDTKIPALLISTYDDFQFYGLNMGRNQQIVCIEQATGKCFVLPEQYHHKKYNYAVMDKFVPAPLAELDETEIETLKDSRNYGVKYFDLNEFFRLHWENSIYYVYTLFYDYISEPVSFQIINSSSTIPSAMLPILPHAGQASAVITHAKKKMDSAGEKYSIEISDTVNVQSDSLPVKITFSVTIKKEWLFFQWENDKKPVPKALIPVSVFVTKFNQDQKKPISWHWTVPVFSSEKVNEGDQAEGFLITDLFHEEHNIRVEREFLAWCVVGTHLFGPEKFLLKK